LIRGISIPAVLILLIVSGLVLFRERPARQARVNQRVPLQKLAYCTPKQITPCVVSFGRDADENMIVNVLTAGAFYPDFYLTIKADERDHIYVCEKANTFATSVYCTGQILPVGRAFQFLLFSLNEDILLAQGSFPIIGVALVTPPVFVTPTTSPTPLPPGTPSPSYPSYPNTSPE
jgi:hypothetical protein